MNCEAPPYVPSARVALEKADSVQLVHCVHRRRCLDTAASFDMPAMSCRDPKGNWCGEYEQRTAASLSSDHEDLLRLARATVELRPCLGCRRRRPAWELLCGECGHSHHKADDHFKSPREVLCEDGTRWKRSR